MWKSGCMVHLGSMYNLGDVRRMTAMLFRVHSHMSATSVRSVRRCSIVSVLPHEIQWGASRSFILASLSFVGTMSCITWYQVVFILLEIQASCRFFFPNNVPAYVRVQRHYPHDRIGFSCFFQGRQGSIQNSNHDLSRRVAEDLRLRPLGHWDRQT